MRRRADWLWARLGDLSARDHSGSEPKRYGKQVWEIDYPTRAGDKFFKGDGENYWLWGWGLRYPLLFPDDGTYTVGKSDYRKDWFFQQTPHATSTAWKNPDAKDPAKRARRPCGWRWPVPTATADWRSRSTANPSAHCGRSPPTPCGTTPTRASGRNSR